VQPRLFKQNRGRGKARALSPTSPSPPVKILFDQHFTVLDLRDLSAAEMEFQKSFFSELIFYVLSFYFRIISTLLEAVTNIDIVIMYES